MSVSSISISSSSISSSSISSSLDNAIQLNNDGVSHALCGEADHAISAFSRALCIFKKLITADDTFDTHTSSTSTSSNNNNVVQQLHSSARALPRAKDTVFFLFHSVVCLRPRSEQSQSEHRAADSHVYCAVIILNLAVLHHQQAISGSGNGDASEIIEDPYTSYRQRSVSLHKAERFYDMVTMILTNDHYADDTHPTSLVARLAALNNIAHIRMERGDFGKCDQSLRMLACLVQEVFHNIDLFQFQSTMLDVQDIEGMMLNVLMANRQQAAPAA